MADKFQFDLISPEKVLFSDQVKEVNLCGSEGFFSVLAGHEPLITRVLPGPVRISKEQGEDIQYIVFSGFIDVEKDRTSLMAEEAVPLEKLNQNDIDQRIAHARNMLKDVHTDEKKSQIEEFIYHLSTIKSGNV